MRKKANKNIFLLFILISNAFTVMLSVFSIIKGYETIGYVALSICAVLLLSSFIVYKGAKKHFYRFYTGLAKEITIPNSRALTSLKIPILVLEGERVVWYSTEFKSKVLKGNDAFDTTADELLGDVTASSLRVSDKIDFEIENKLFTIYKSTYIAEEEISILYFFDDTTLKNTAKEFSLTRPVVAVLSLDSFDDSSDNIPDSQKAAIISSVEKEIEKWASQTVGFTRKLNSRQYLFVLDERNLSVLKKDKFEVLERIRNLKFEGYNTPLTLSIGVGRGGKTIKECETFAFKALEMAQGRGGDQAVIKTANDYEFFGGVNSTGKELTTKVKARVISSALKELIRGSDCVYIVGHKFSDLDCIGAALGLYKASTSCGLRTYIVSDTEKSLAKNLINSIKETYGNDVFLSPDVALEMATRKSLVIVVDTHRANFTECPGLLEKCQTYVVIDHHRLSVDHIENAVIFYSETSTSSTCEMVTELIQYIDDKIISKIEANALLAGITLDTRNFVLSTGVRTFEASAYLRSRGADTVEVKKLFSDSIDVYKEKSDLISSAKIYKNCAVSFSEQSTAHTRIAASQAADELLGISNVKASFIIYMSGTTANISARSYGGLNVQIIMEKLGGGGHHTMAACQLQDTSIKIACEKLLKIIDELA